RSTTERARGEGGSGCIEAMGAAIQNSLKIRRLNAELAEHGEKSWTFLALRLGGLCVNRVSSCAFPAWRVDMENLTEAKRMYQKYHDMSLDLRLLGEFVASSMPPA